MTNTDVLSTALLPARAGAAVSRWSHQAVRTYSTSMSLWHEHDHAEGCAQSPVQGWDHVAGAVWPGIGPHQ
eukprot:16429083-Heterocapsa_arctica.AAC.1